MTVLIIDGDMIAYYSCPPREDKEVFKITPEFQTTGKADKVYTDAENVDYLKQCWSIFENRIKRLQASVFCTELLMGVGGSTNYRNLTYPILRDSEGKTICGYKHSRRNKSSNPLDYKVIPALKTLSVMHGYAVLCEGRETDDYVRIWAEEAKWAGKDYVICTGDKDLRCIPGNHLHPKEESISVVSELEAMTLYYQQLIMGDSTDCIPGLRLHGPVKAAKLTERCTTHEEFQMAVIEAYYNVHGEKDWANYLLANGKLIHIQRHICDYFSFEEWPLARELLGLDYD
jgi:hypothetical protein